MNDNIENKEITTEERILKAAEKEFLDKGFAGARTTSIAEAAGVTHAMLHYYFRTKEKLFEKILGEKVTHLKGIMLGSMLDTEMPILNKVKHAVESHLDFLANNPELPRFMLSVMTANPEWLTLFKDSLANTDGDIIETLQDELDRGAELGVCKRLDARMLLLDIVSLNAFSFIGAPLINTLIGPICDDPHFIEDRKKNNVEMIMQKMRP